MGKKIYENDIVKGRRILRDLAKRVAEIAALPEQKTRRDLWHKHNALKQGKVMVLCYPLAAWTELAPDELFHMDCSPDAGREISAMGSWERRLWTIIRSHEYLHDDQVIEPVFDVHYVYSYSDWGMHEEQRKVEERGSWTWDPPLKKLEDIDKLRFREISIDYGATQKNVELANDIFGDILTVRKRGGRDNPGFWWTVSKTYDIALLRGLEQVMLDLCDHPEWLHRVMAFLYEGTRRELDFFENEGVLALNNGPEYVGSGGVGYTDELPREGYEGKVRLCDLWGFAESQEFTGVSPSMFEEFVLKYQLPLLSRFGLNCYGCCESLNGKFDLIKRIPNLRRVSVSPWSDLREAVDVFQDKYILSWRPNPAVMAALTFNPDKVKSDIKQALEIAKDCVLEIVLKDIETVNHDLTRFDKWTKIAQELTDNS